MLWMFVKNEELTRARPSLDGRLLSLTYSSAISFRVSILQAKHHSRTGPGGRSTVGNLLIEQQNNLPRMLMSTVSSPKVLFSLMQMKLLTMSRRGAMSSECRDMEVD